MSMQPRTYVPFDVFGMRDDVRVSTMVRVGDKGWTCGLCPLDAKARVVAPNDLTAQAAFVADMIQAVFARADFDVHDAAKLVIYHAAASVSETQALLALFQDRFPGGPVLVPVVVPYFYYDGMLLEVDAYADASLQPRVTTASGLVQVRRGRELTYVACDAEASADVNEVIAGTGVSTANPLVENAFWPRPLDHEAMSLGTSVILPETGGKGSAIIDWILCKDARVVQGSSAAFLTVAQAGDLFVLTATHPMPDVSLLDQARAVMAQLDQALKTCGLTWAHVVKVSAPYVGSGTEDDLHQNLKVRHSYHALPGPASTGLPVQAFADSGCRICVQLFAHR